MRGPRHIDQFCAGFASGDAISNEALILQKFFRELGFRSEIYTENFTDRDAERVFHYRHYHPRRDSILVYHHSFHSGILNELRRYPARARILIFHNVTPARYVEPYNRALATSLALALEEVAELINYFQVVLADSEFNAGVLRKLGYRDPRVMPVPVHFGPAEAPELPPRLSWLRDGRANVLFVGRIFPNKRHQDLLKAFHFFRRLRPDSRLLLVGPAHPGTRGYTGELRNLSADLGLGEHVVFTGMVSDEDIRAYYANSHLFLSMSDHEGFFVPLLECMRFGLPVLAYDSSVIRETLGESGVVFREKDFARIAEMMDLLVEDGPLRRSVIEAQRLRLRQFAPEASLETMRAALRELGVKLPESSPVFS